MRRKRFQILVRSSQIGPKRVFLYGYFGASNLGDQILEKTSKDLISFPNRELQIITRRQHFYRTPTNFPNWLRSFVVKVSVLVSLIWNIAHVIRVDLVVFGGGGVMSSEVSWIIRLEQKLLVRLGRFFGANVVGIGLEIADADLQKGRFSGDQYPHSLLQEFDFLWLRDFPSFESCRGMRNGPLVVGGEDLALVNRDLVEEFSKGGGPSICDRNILKIGVSVPADLFELEDEAILPSRLLLQCLKSKSNFNLRWNGISAQEFEAGAVSKSDSRTLRYLGQAEGLSFETIRKLDLFENSDFRQLFEEIRKYDLVLAGRFHVALLALLAGIPTVILSVNGKLRRLSETLGAHDSNSLIHLDSCDFELALLSPPNQVRIASAIARGMDARDFFQKWISELLV